MRTGGSSRSATGSVAVPPSWAPWISGRRNRHLHLHAAALEPDEVVGIDGLLLTSLPRTLLDVARHLPFEQALVPVNAALHQHRVTPEQLGRALERAAHRAGNTAARQVLAFARAGAASPGETRSRLAIHRAGLSKKTPKLI